MISKLFPIPKFTEEDYKEAERQAGLSERQKKKEAKENKKFVRSLHHIDDEEYIEKHKEELAELEAEKEVKNVPEKKVGETSSAKNAPAPIKNDEKDSYAAKNSDSDKKPEERQDNK